MAKIAWDGQERDKERWKALLAAVSVKLVVGDE